MRLNDITALADPLGHRIAISWVNVDPTAAPGVRVVRREGTHPTSPGDGVVVTEGTDVPFNVTELGYPRYTVWDEGLKGETVYYYALFPYATLPDYQVDLHNRTSAMATAAYGMGAQMYQLLPRIYARYDTLVPQSAAAVPEALRDSGELRRFLELPGTLLDQLYSYARAALNLFDLDRVDGRLLPLLAQWIGWETDYRREIDAQRNELRNAPSLYGAIGIIPAVEATVKRVLGWDSRTKEFVNNVFVSNEPERLNVWLRERDAGVWSEPIAPFSVDDAYHGRPAAVRMPSGTLWLFYHTLRWGDAEIWYKAQGPEDAWSPSRPLQRKSSVGQNPTAAQQGSRVWVFWESYEAKTHFWRIAYTTTEDEGQTWSEQATFGDTTTQRRRPVAIIDAAGGLWLFWLERIGDTWPLRYSRHDGTGWAAQAAQFPMSGPGELQMSDDFFVLYHPTDAARRIWVFWASKQAIGPAPNVPADQTRSRIAYRVKQSSDFGNVTDWGAVTLLPPADATSSDREPAACVDSQQGAVELYWSSNRNGNWAIWRVLIDTGTPEEITATPFTDRHPLAVANGATTLLAYRSNQGSTYRSQVYGATETIDLRAIGSTTLDTANVARAALRGRFEDIQSYTYDTGRGGVRDNATWYARDTIGIYLRPGTEDQQSIRRNQQLIAQALSAFLPIQTRAVFIIEPIIYPDRVFPQDFPREQFVDALTTAAVDAYGGSSDAYADGVRGWVWMHAWSQAYSDQRTVDFTTTPVDTRFRTWHTSLTQEE